MHTPRLWTIGHSTRPLEVFIDLLRADGITTLVDVRRYPGSRRHPHFAAQSLMHSLPEAGIGFVPMPELGGRRRARRDSPHTAWRSAGFRGYADYMEAAEYAQARARLMALASAEPTACMCAEAMWWSCHRSLIADDFKARGWDVVHLMAPGKSQPHPWTAAARIVDGRLDYSTPAPSQDDLFGRQT